MLIQKVIAVIADPSATTTSNDAIATNTVPLTETIGRIVNTVTLSLLGLSLAIFIIGLVEFILNRVKLKKFDAQHNLRMYSRSENVLHFLVILHGWLIFIGLVLIIQSGLYYHPVLKYIPLLGILLMLHSVIARLIFNKKYKKFIAESKIIINEKLNNLNSALIQERNTLKRRVGHYNKMAGGALFAALILFFWYLVTHFMVCCSIS